MGMKFEAVAMRSPLTKKKKSFPVRQFSPIDYCEVWRNMSFHFMYRRNFLLHEIV